MTDKLIEQIKAEKQEGPVEGDVATVMSEYLNAMEDRILADAEVIKAADVLAEAADDQLVYMDMCDDIGDLEENLRAALANFREAQDRASLEEKNDE